MKTNTIIAGIDIGNTKITTVISETGPDGTADIIGEASVPTDGLKRGAIINLERTAEAIESSLAAAERVAGVHADTAYIGVSGQHVKAITSHGLAAIRRQQAISAADIDRAVENGRAVSHDPHYEAIHVLPQEYVVDGQDGVKNPIGLNGVRLEVDVHLITAHSGTLNNVRRCVQDAGVREGGVALKILAAGIATLEPHERGQTVLLIDMGGGTTDVGLFRRGNLAYTTSVPYGSDSVTTDLAHILKVGYDDAELLKRKLGAACPTLADDDLSATITTIEGAQYTVHAHELARVIHARITEILNMIHADLSAHFGAAFLADSVILTGGGSLLRGASDVTRTTFHLPVRIGRPRGIGGLTDIVASPAHATAVGLALYGLAGDGDTQALLARPEPDVRVPAPQRPPTTPAPAPKKRDKPRPEPRPDIRAVQLDFDAPQVPDAPARTRPQGPSLKDKLTRMFREWL
ncbi:cell division protein FtsA [Deinococcus soli (ex Cha et al. 2016)]|uniref:Cell division protein FtsA n=2 Tax=Deinococcus soli (ex Cha et al. 2016) TaxID=1309411 RepID=A0AAE3XEP8_9DEIO|nr:cell division protein FtsA [Deinococcus soli (ex Cha et al. 2016)]MDR6218755.1 cell division protein FtsA [Deinococcus soli (ex Cha et al. 2016)]MDR6328552.1 cell division protein FtsA [Deinococcus soli (ex Cha et al. 2016)]MDR6751961.1 cell division protein FtsA [Deinococcus soli (ex Cha et al. 2016)]